jgi:hypothetical protein
MIVTTMNDIQGCKSHVWCLTPDDVRSGQCDSEVAPSQAVRCLFRPCQVSDT